MRHASRARRALRLLALLVVAWGSVVLQRAEGRVITQKYPLHKFVSEAPEERIRYIAKFGMDLGSGSYYFSARLNREVDNYYYQSILLYLSIYLDDTWEAIDWRESCAGNQEKARVKQMVHLPLSGEWVRVNGQLAQSAKRHVWFFYLSQCETQQILANSELKNNLHKYSIQVEITIQNSDDSHFSTEEKGLLAPLFALFLWGAGVLLLTARRAYQLYRREDQLDWPLTAVLAALALQSAAFLLQTAHLLVYDDDGRGWVFFHILSEMLAVTSQFLITCLLILMSQGWAIIYRKIENADVLGPLAVLVGGSQVIIVALDKMNDNSSSKYHQFDSGPGYIILGLKLATGAYFLYGVCRTLRRFTQKIRQLVNQVTAFGSLYMLAFPLLVLASHCAAPYVRHTVVCIGTYCIQTLALTALVYAILAKNSLYNRQGHNSHTILPSDKAE